jgi:hypothetical protein
MTEAAIEVDLGETFDEDYQSGTESATTSLASTIFAHEYENGRRYHAYKAGTYALPNDETEQERFHCTRSITQSFLTGAKFVRI